MSKDQKDLLNRLDALNNNIEILTKVIAVSIGKETLFKEKKQKEQQIAFLTELGLTRNLIAAIVTTTPLSVSVTKSQKKSKQKTASEGTTQKEGVDKSGK